METNKTTVGESLVFPLEGRLDVSTGPGIQEKLLATIAAPDGAMHIVLDFAKLTYISSAGMRILLAAQKTAATHKKLLTICNIPSGIRELLDLVGLLNILPVQEPPQTKD